MNDGIGRIFKRKDGKFMLYLPVAMCTDTMFPFQDFKLTKRGALSISVIVHFDPERKVLVVSQNENEAE